MFFIPETGLYWTALQFVVDTGEFEADKDLSLMDRDSNGDRFHGFATDIGEPEMTCSLASINASDGQVSFGQEQCFSEEARLFCKRDTIDNELIQQSLDPTNPINYNPLLIDNFGVCSTGGIYF